MIVKSYKDLEIYKESLDLAKEIYILTKTFPRDETYGMRDQVRRAVASIGANIAEGFGRFHFIELSTKVDYISSADNDKLNLRLEKLSVRLNNFINSIGATNDKQ